MSKKGGISRLSNAAPIMYSKDNSVGKPGSDIKVMLSEERIQVRGDTVNVKLDEPVTGMFKSDKEPTISIVNVPASELDRLVVETVRVKGSKIMNAVL